MAQTTSRRRPRISNFWLGVLENTNSVAALLALGAGADAPAFTAVATTYQILTTDEVILCDDTGASGFTVTLPARVTGLVHVIKKIDANASTITVASPDAATMDGDATDTLSLIAQYDIVTYGCDGTNWHRLS